MRRLVVVLALLMVLGILALGGVSLFIITSNETNYDYSAQVAMIQATNQFVDTAVAATSVSKSWTATPVGTIPILSVIPTNTLALTSVPNPGNPEIQPTPEMIETKPAELKAGEIDDNKLWDKYLDYRNRFNGRFTVHNVDVSERYIISVTDANQHPILGARVRIYSNQALISDTYTYSSGQTLFFPRTMADTDNQQSFEVTVEKGEETANFTLTRNEKETWSAVLKDWKPEQTRVKLDVLFLLDATGSMGDEIAQLQSNILSISAQINILPGDPDVRYGMVTYRDRGDEYISRIYQFTPNVNKFQQDLNSVTAGGGGDTPESLNAGLHDAIQGVEWRGDDTVKLVFLVADAPPHLDYHDDFDYAQDMEQAARHGIKIFSLAASGLDDQGEYIFRQMAQYTMGHFIFLTYAKDVQSQSTAIKEDKVGEDTNRNVDKQDYQAELLDKLVLRLIKTELAPVTEMVKR